MKKSKLVSLITEVIEEVNFTSLEAKLDAMFDELDIDINFTNHFKERVLERGLTEEDIIELAQKIINQYPDELDFIQKDQNVVFTHLSRLVDIAAVNTGYGEDYLKDLVFKTAYKRNSEKEPEFRTNKTSPKLTVSELTDEEIRHWATQADIFSILKKYPHRYSELSARLKGAQKAALDYFWSTYFKDGTATLENVHEPMNPGILKKRLGKLSCSKVRAERSKLKDKSTTYAKALQRYLNYHCQ